MPYALPRAARVDRKIFTLKLTEDRDVLGMNLFRGTELVRGNLDPSHVLR